MKKKEKKKNYTFLTMWTQQIWIWIRIKITWIRVKYFIFNQSFFTNWDPAKTASQKNLFFTGCLGRKKNVLVMILINLHSSLL